MGNVNCGKRGGMKVRNFDFLGKFGEIWRNLEGKNIQLKLS
jgi:hypothetical protein